VVGGGGGYRLMRRYGHYVRVDEAKMKVGRYLFDRHGGKVVFFGRFVSVLRTYAAFLAGTNRMRWSRFLVYNAAGGILWATLFGLGAYFLGGAIHRVSTVVTYVGVAIAVIAIVMVIVFTRRHMKALEAVAEEAYPGPLDGPSQDDATSSLETTDTD
jgi:membrane protein DedA with SNARE-associated domain